MYLIFFYFNTVLAYIFYPTEHDTSLQLYTVCVQGESDASESDLDFEALFLGEIWRSLDTDNVTGHPVFRVSLLTSSLG